MPALGGVVFGWAAVRSSGLALPIGLHLGGNRIQASVLSFQPPFGGPPQGLFTAM
jgi:membrane protease YdiL (CAAX protease family)